MRCPIFVSNEERADHFVVLFGEGVSLENLTVIKPHQDLGILLALVSVLDAIRVFDIVVSLVLKVVRNVVPNELDHLLLFYGQYLLHLHQTTILPKL